jgi:heme/copper-type cytochrome/quinol oxidase subunit 2
VRHAVLALILTGVLASQVRAFVALLRSRRGISARGASRKSDVVWMAIPVAVVLVLAARSWIAAFDLSSPAPAAHAPAEVSSRLPSAPIFHR